MPVTTKTVTKTAAFPKLDLEMVLRDELLLAADAEAGMHGITLPSSTDVAVVAPVPLDSLSVVELLCAVEPVLGFQPTDATVRTGGYNSVQDALNHLMPRLEQQWLKKQGVSA